MVNNWLKIAIFASIGFLIPVAIGVTFAPSLFQPHASGKPEGVFRDSRRAALKPAGDSLKAFSALVVDDSSAFGRVAHDALLDPPPAQTFVAAFAVNFRALPRIGKRLNIITKYDAERLPHAGWAIGLNRRSTSVRPEVYWRGQQGQGGWFTFDQVEIVPGRWYSVTLVARANEFLNLYFTELDRDQSGEGATVFLGGADVSGIGPVASEGPLNFGATNTGGYNFSGRVSLLLVARLDDLPGNPDKLSKIIGRSPERTQSSLPAQGIALWIGQDGRDHSMFNREIELGGSASWQSSAM